MRLLRHPFGINENDLRRLLDRRGREHAHALSEAGSRQQRLRAANAERLQYLTLLQEDLTALEAEERRLSRALGSQATEIEEAELAANLAEMQARLDQTRALIRTIALGVFQLISPNLGAGQKGEQHDQA